MFVSLSQHKHELHEKGSLNIIIFNDFRKLLSTNEEKSLSDMFSGLFKKKKEEEDINDSDDSLRTALMMACHKQSPQCVRYITVEDFPAAWS